ncbi:MAG TPA: nucleotidyltransferase family protein [Candidatus Cybelea sp.]
MRAVILAAGSSSRIGKQKLLMPFRGRPLIEYSIEAAARWQPVVVCSREVAHHLAGRADVALIRNEEPELGMSHSLTLANRAIEEDVAIGVLLADKPLVSEDLIETVRRASRGADVTYPQHGGQPGHPVVLSPRARRFIDHLPPGDTVRLLRAHLALSVHPVDTADEGAFFDIDTIDAFEP